MRKVENLAAEGLSQDQIAAEIGINRRNMVAKHFRHQIADGREREKAMRTEDNLAVRLLRLSGSRKDRRRSMRRSICCGRGSGGSRQPIQLPQRNQPYPLTPAKHPLFNGCRWVEDFCLGDRLEVASDRGHRNERPVDAATFRLVRECHRTTWAASCTRAVSRPSSA